MIRFKIDIISDVVCPWCIVGYSKLQQAITELENTQQITFDVTWHPFELAPDLASNGENLRDFLAKKYPQSPAGGEQARKQLTQIGADLGFTFNFSEDMLRYNTFKAHQMLAWAKSTQTPAQSAHPSMQTTLKLALFKAYFSDHKDISNNEVLSEIAASVGFSKTDALQILEESSFAQNVRDEQQTWINQGINSVPSVVIENKYLIPGALEKQDWIKTIQQVIEQSDN